MSSIRSFVIAGIVLFHLALVATIVIVIHIHSKSEAINENWLPSAIHLSRVNTLTSDYRIHELQHILSPVADEMSVYEDMLRQLEASIDIELRMYENLITTPEEARLYQIFKERWRDYLNESKLLIELSRSNRNVEATARARGKSEALFNEFSATLNLLVEENKMHASLESRAGETLFWITLANLLLMTLILMALGYKTLRFIRTMVDRVVDTCVNILSEHSRG